MTPATATPTSTLTVTAPSGAHFKVSKVGPRGGDKVPMPILVWDNLDAAIALLGETAVKAGLSGGLTNKYREIARAGAAEGKTQDEVALEQIAYRPAPKARKSKPKTAATRMRGAVKNIAKTFTEAQQAAVAILLEDIANGRTVLNEEEVATLRA